MKCDVLTENKKVGSIDLADGVFGLVRKDIISRMVNW